MKTILAGCFLLAATLAAEAQTITTPVLTLIDSKSSNQAFHLVSQSATSTVIQLDDIGAAMQGSVTGDPDSGPAEASLHREQFFNLFIAPSYTLYSIALVSDLSLAASGQSYTGPYASYASTMTVDGAVRGTVYGDRAARQPVDATAFAYLGYGEPLGNAFTLDIDLRAYLYARAAPWLASSASIVTHSVRLELATREVSPIPEPATAPLLLAGLGLLALLRSRTMLKSGDTTSS